MRVDVKHTRRDALKVSLSAHIDERYRGSVIVPTVLVYAIIDVRSSTTHPLGDAVETFAKQEDAEHFFDEVRRDDPELACYLRIEGRELVAGGEN